MAHTQVKHEFIIALPEYEGIGVYALVDDTGKMYIGSSKHIRKRIQKHNQDIKAGTENNNILQAISAGRTFQCQILRKINYGACLYDIRKIETEYINKLKPAYNISSGSYLPPEFHLKGYKEALHKGNSESAKYWLNMYQKLSKPIYAKNNLKRIPLDVQKEKYDQIKAAADAAVEKVNSYIKRAVDDRMAHDTKQMSSDNE